MYSKTFPAFEKKIYLSSPTKHHEMLDYIQEAYDSNWISTIGENINEIEHWICERTGSQYAVAVTTGTSALHLCMKLAGMKLGDKVFCSDMTFSATVNPVCYEGAEPIFIDSEQDSWNMSPEALKKAFELYPDTRYCVVADLYGTPAKLDEIRAICDEHGAILIEDAAEALGASLNGKSCGTFGEYNAISFNGNKIITGSSGGMVLTDDAEAAAKVHKWSTQAKDNAPWYQHSEIGYNYRMSNIIAGAIRGQLPYLGEHIAQKKAIYERYKEGLKDLPVRMNPIIGSEFGVRSSEENAEIVPNYWLSCLTIDPEAMCEQTRTDTEAHFTPEHDKSCPTEILQAIASINAEGRPIWKPMHMQPFYADCAFVSACEHPVDEDIFERGICLPSDNKMMPSEQDRIIEVIKACFD